MLIKNLPSADLLPIIKKSIDGNDTSHRGAVSCGKVIKITVDVPRLLGASAVVLRIAKDAERDKDIPLTFVSTDRGTDTYAVDIDTALLCGSDEQGLFYYELLFLRGVDTLFTDTHNFVDYTLTDHPARRFILLVHRADFETPEWFRGRIMYHIFVDRFYKGDGEIGERDDAIVNDDWYEGVMQYPEKLPKLFVSLIKQTILAVSTHQGLGL